MKNKQNFYKEACIMGSIGIEEPPSYKTSFWFIDYLKTTKLLLDDKKWLNLIDIKVGFGFQ